MDKPFTRRDLTIYGGIADACANGQRVRWSLDGEHISEGVARNITAKDGMSLGERDVREGYLWISGMMEHWIPMTEVVELYTKGLFVIDSH
jgi:hypothetical protein